MFPGAALDDEMFEQLNEEPFASPFGHEEDDIFEPLSSSESLLPRASVGGAGFDKNNHFEMHLPRGGHSRVKLTLDEGQLIINVQQGEHKEEKRTADGGFYMSCSSSAASSTRSFSVPSWVHGPQNLHARISGDTLEIDAIRNVVGGVSSSDVAVGPVDIPIERE